MKTIKKFGSFQNVSTVPEASQPDGSVSYADGYGPDYELPYDHHDSKDIERKSMNGLFHDITSSIRETQQNSIVKWSADLEWEYGDYPWVYHNQKVWEWDTSSPPTGANIPGVDPSWREVLSGGGGASLDTTITYRVPQDYPDIIDALKEATKLYAAYGGYAVIEVQQGFTPIKQVVINADFSWCNIKSAGDVQVSKSDFIVEANGIHAFLTCVSGGKICVSGEWKSTGDPSAQRAAILHAVGGGEIILDNFTAPHAVDSAIVASIGGRIVGTIGAGTEGGDLNSSALGETILAFDGGEINIRSISTVDSCHIKSSSIHPQGGGAIVAQRGGRVKVTGYIRVLSDSSNIRGIVSDSGGHVDFQGTITTGGVCLTAANGGRIDMLGIQKPPTGHLPPEKVLATEASSVLSCDSSSVIDVRTTNNHPERPMGVTGDIVVDAGKVRMIGMSAVGDVNVKAGELELHCTSGGGTTLSKGARIKLLSSVIAYLYIVGGGPAVFESLDDIEIQELYCINGGFIEVNGDLYVNDDLFLIGIALRVYGELKVTSLNLNINSSNVYAKTTDITSNVKSYAGSILHLPGFTGTTNLTPNAITSDGLLIV